MKHTPGPWTIKIDTQLIYDRYTGKPTATSNTWVMAGDGVGDSVALMFGGLTPEKLKTYSNLIAAAPDMLESLDELYAELSLNGIEEDHLAGPSQKAIKKMLAKAEKAIARARGDS